jgi:branched-chain amino acid transport system permease protein
VRSPVGPSSARDAGAHTRPDPIDRWLPILLFTALGGALLALDAAGQTFYVKLLTRMMILALAAVALDLVVGIAGLVSLGQAAFLGIGAYGVGILAEHGITSGWIQWPVATLAAALFAALVGALSLRTRGVHFIMITLAFGQMLFYAATSLSRYGGDDGLTLLERSRFDGLISLADRRSFAWLAFAALLATYLVLRRAKAARFGRVLLGARENERRMAAMGYPVARYRLVAFTIAGTLTGLSGILLANLSEFVAPAYMSWHRSGELLAMVVLGGLGTLHGSVLGACVFLLLEEALSSLTTHWALVFGPLLILVVIFSRGGLVGALRRLRTLA